MTDNVFYFSTLNFMVVPSVEPSECVPAFNGGLVASLTLPVRSKAVNTFADLLNLPNEATIAIGRWSSHYEMLQNATDPVLQVPYV